MLLDAPHLLPTPNSLPAPVAELDEIVPLPRLAQPVDEAKELVDIRRLDCLQGLSGDQGLSPTETGRS